MYILRILLYNHECIVNKVVAHLPLRILVFPAWSFPSLLDGKVVLHTLFLSRSIMDPGGGSGDPQESLQASNYDEDGIDFGDFTAPDFPQEFSTPEAMDPRPIEDDPPKWADFSNEVTEFLGDEEATEDWGDFSSVPSSVPADMPSKSTEENHEDQLKMERNLLISALLSNPLESKNWQAIFPTMFSGENLQTESKSPVERPNHSSCNWESSFRSLASQDESSQEIFEHFEKLDSNKISFSALFEPQFSWTGSNSERIVFQKLEITLPEDRCDFSIYRLANTSSYSPTRISRSRKHERTSASQPETYENEKNDSTNSLEVLDNNQETSIPEQYERAVSASKQLSQHGGLDSFERFRVALTSLRSDSPEFVNLTEEDSRRMLKSLPNIDFMLSSSLEIPGMRLKKEEIL